MCGGLCGVVGVCELFGENFGGIGDVWVEMGFFVYLMGGDCGF